MDNKKVRGKRASNAQLEVMINYLENNKIEMMHGKCHPLNLRNLETKWEELTSLLNDVPNGARKNKDSWKKFLTEFKSKTKKRARLLRAHQVQTGGGGYENHELSDLENRYLNIAGWVSILGTESLPPEVDPQLVLVPAEDVEEVLVNTENDMDVANIEASTSTNIKVEGTSVEVPKAKGKKNIRRGRINTHLEEQAQAHLKATTKLATSVDGLAKSTSKLADSMSEIAVALNAIAEKLTPP